MIRMAEPLAWEVDVEPSGAGRQLRLVPDESVRSLAAYLLALHVGSACCWCGGTLAQSPGGTRLRLECVSCGAVVESSESVHDDDVRL